MELSVNTDDWRQEFIDWLDSFVWLWVCSLTFRPGLSKQQRQWRVRQWANELREQLGTKNFSWIAIPESGRTGLAPHYHALVGGLRDDDDAGDRLEWMRRWWKLSGDARIDPYKPNAGGIAYILKSVGPDDVDDFEIHICSESRMQSGFELK
jgi:hypothetical protein